MFGADCRASQKLVPDMKSYLCLFWIPLAFGLVSFHADAHGFAGARFFPSTIATEDPFVSDELSLNVSSFREDQSSRITGVDLDYTKRITRRFGLGFGESFQHVNPDGAPSGSGFGNLGLSAQYLVLQNGDHETLLKIAVDGEIGGTGNADVGAEPTSVISPGIFFGKGFGDLPQSMSWLRPLAVTGGLAFDVPLKSTGFADGAIERNPHVLKAGLAIEYSLPYLQSQVRDVGLGAPFDRLIPLVELTFSAPLDRGQSGDTVSTINPGVIWVGDNFQLGAEAIVPANHRSGDGVGVIFQLHLFVDDLFPRSLGAPLFRRRR